MNRRTNSPPAVTRLANHPMTTDELLPTAKKDKIGKIMTTQKQYIGTPDLVHFWRTLGARPSRERAYKFLTAQYV